MKKQVAFLLLGALCLLAIPSYGQKLYRFGKFDQAQLEMTEDEVFPDAEALVLLSDGYSHMMVQPGAGIRMRNNYHIRIKILKQSGFDYAEIEIPYFREGGGQILSNIKASTFNLTESGKMIEQKLDRKSFFEEEKPGGLIIKKFTFPNVKEGTIIEYQYSITGGIAYPPTWYFQRSIPTKRTRHSFKVPNGFFYQPMMLGEVANLRREEKSAPSEVIGTDNEVIYTGTDVPGMKDEAYVLNMRNYFGRIRYQLKSINVPGYAETVGSTWAEIAQQYREYSGFGGVAFNKTLGRRVLDRALSTRGEDDDKLATVYAYCRFNTNQGSYFSEYTNVSASTLPGGKEPLTSGAVNLMLVAGLRAAGYQAFPVIVSTRANGALQSFFPDDAQFNHVLAYVKLDEGYILMDAVSEGYGPDMLPWHDLNTGSQGMLISSSGYEWIPLAPKYTGKHNCNATLKLSADGTLSGKLSFTEKGYSGASARIAYMEVDEDPRKCAMDYFIDTENEIEVTEIEVNGEKEITAPFKMKFQMETDGFVQTAGDRMYIQPMLFEQFSDNPFKAEKRTYPVDFGYARNNSYMLNLEIPEGYVIEESPQPVRISTPDQSATFVFNVMAMGNRVQLISQMQLNKSQYLSKEYEALRQLYDMMVQKHGEQIVLRKET